MIEKGKFTTEESIAALSLTVEEIEELEVIPVFTEDSEARIFLKIIFAEFHGINPELWSFVESVNN